MFSSDTNFVPLINSNDSSPGASSDFIQFYADRFGIQFDPDWTARQCRMYILKLFYQGRIYNNLAPWWSEYQGDGGKYIPLLKRRPSVIFNLARVIVNESTSMLFSADHFPAVRCEDDEINDFLQYVTRKGNFRYSMMSAARKGALGSTCIVIKILNKQFHLDVLGTSHLIPIFDPLSPNTLTTLYEKRKCLGETLVQMGYDIPQTDKEKPFYLCRKWTESEEIYYKPYLCGDEIKPESERLIKDDKKSSMHDLGFVPAIWIKNSAECHHIDGECTFESVMDTCIEIDYQLSQLARLLRYNSDPTMVIRDSSKLGDEDIIKGGGNALMLGREGEAYMLEITGASTKAVIDFVRMLREFALEVVRGNRANPDKMHAAQSGRALQLLQSALISLVDELRICYGDNGLIKIYQMILRMCATGTYEIATGDTKLPTGNYQDADLTLAWGEWYPETPQDKLQEAQALVTLKNDHVISSKTATTTIAENYNITDLQEEFQDIEKESADEEEAKEMESQAIQTAAKSGVVRRPKKNNEQDAQKEKKK